MRELMSVCLTFSISNLELAKKQVSSQEQVAPMTALLQVLHHHIRGPFI